MIFNLTRFIREHITHRNESLFQNDLLTNRNYLLENIQSKKVLVIGGAGTIGSYFIKALLNYSPSTLIIVDVNENGLTELTRDLRSSNEFKVPVNYITYPIAFTSPIFDKILKAWGPFDIVANFAAHKHVRSEKDIFSIEAMLENNVIQAKYLLEKIQPQNPKHFFCVSTDKAANPVSVMGASKKIMEDLILAYSSEMKVTTARFANVAFSNGSLLAGFFERVLKQQPIVAPTDIKRYFVSPIESGQLCLLACVLGNTGEIFFPKLGKENMTGFSRIAEKFLNTLGYEIEICSSEEEAKEKSVYLSENSKKYPVYFFESDTSGEKPYEEFYTNEERVQLDRFGALGVIQPFNKPTKAELSNLFSELHTVMNRETFSKKDLVEALKIYLKSFNHIEKEKSLDQKM